MILCPKFLPFLNPILRGVGSLGPNNVDSSSVSSHIYMCGHIGDGLVCCRQNAFFVDAVFLME